MADKNDRRAGPPLPPIPGLGKVRYIPPEEMRVGYPPQCTEIDEGARKDMEFLNAMTPEEAQKYMGQWIAVAGGGVVAHGEDPMQVCEAGWKAGKGCPHMEYIYAKPEEVPWLYVPK